MELLTVEAPAIIVSLSLLATACLCAGTYGMRCSMFGVPEGTCCMFGSNGISCGEFPDPWSRPISCERDSRGS